ncbi:hypothetical protein CHLRE_10g450926v5 [Chlamydomonas reinhardtii]|uniref:Uncharacterized protein n=1 Tax=Chlamydomonas reinhardtii TaxID=3055 RepID=A0A2K3DB61_CHLRE|nr:uncharacterized protein CHLRE_10g450926v5 [Chlamydomonas reinhardtii]PNW77769.1 hypothetical protein CHLRE_10g450926v5 [Chlamydomonas reinhardtii]
MRGGAINSRLYGISNTTSAQVSCPPRSFTPEEDARATTIAKAICSGAIVSVRLIGVNLAFVSPSASIPGPPKIEVDKTKPVQSAWAPFRPAPPAPYKPFILNSPPCLLVPPLPTSSIETYQWTNKFMLANPPLFNVDPDEPDVDLLADVCNFCQFIYVTVSFPGPPKVEADKASHVRSSWASFRPASPAPYRPSLNSPPRSPASSVASGPLRHSPLPTSPIETYQWTNRFMLANPPLFNVESATPPDAVKFFNTLKTELAAKYGVEGGGGGGAASAAEGGAAGAGAAAGTTAGGGAAVVVGGGFGSGALGGSPVLLLAIAGGLGLVLLLTVLVLLRVTSELGHSARAFEALTGALDALPSRLAAVAQQQALAAAQVAQACPFDGSGGGRRGSGGDFGQPVAVPPLSATGKRGIAAAEGLECACLLTYMGGCEVGGTFGQAANLPQPWIASGASASAWVLKSGPHMFATWALCAR